MEPLRPSTEYLSQFDDGAGHRARHVKRNICTDQLPSGRHCRHKSIELPVNNHF